MKIKNEIIQIKNGSKTYEFNNLILDEYLRRFVVSQLSIDEALKIQNSLNFTSIFIKFDTPIENIMPNSEITNSQFDIVIIGYEKRTKRTSKNMLNIEYDFEINDNSLILEVATGNVEEGILRKYVGRKIATIGFNYYYGKTTLTDKIGAILDTSKYNIYIQENQDIEIVRKDTITIDTIFNSNNSLIDFPLHLVPVTKGNYGIIESICLGINPKQILKEYIIGKDILLTHTNTEINIKEIDNPNVGEGIYISPTLYASPTLFPKPTNYRYLIIKYAVYDQEGNKKEYNYTESIPINKIGKIDLKIKYERS